MLRVEARPASLGGIQKGGFISVRLVLMISIRKIQREGLESQNRCLFLLQDALEEFRSPRGWADFPDGLFETARKGGVWQFMFFPCAIAKH